MKSGTCNVRCKLLSVNRRTGKQGSWMAHLLRKQRQAHKGLKKVANPPGLAAVMGQAGSSSDQPRSVAQGGACTGLCSLDTAKEVAVMHLLGTK